MNDTRLAELREKFKDRNLLEELGWGAYHNHSGYTSKADGEFLNWLCNAAYKAIKALPSAQPEIVHCKDCKWWDKQDFLQGRCALLGIRPTGGWFCANADVRGEKENENNIQ